MSKQQNKIVKLQPKVRQLTWGQKVVPELRINGVWLEENGFKAGAQVEIVVSKNQLVIKPIS